VKIITELMLCDITVKHSVATFAGSVGLWNGIWEDPRRRYIGNRYQCARCVASYWVGYRHVGLQCHLRHLCVNNGRDDCSSYYYLATYYDFERDWNRPKWRTT